ncbi:uncharacterized protein LOC131226633 [Magnolia sinica]|uniref:uncharacterized protein LOC131226633 n=1 Tax=Magnolia sinica TaxID=86752 RepID=UPI00265B43D0|nr:uncharacterized protein LOC131226633 [Magnolia sinica]
MSPASRSKSKDKSSARAAAKEQQKASPKPSSAPPNAGSGIPASAYNPVSGTFHTLETVTPVSSPPPQNNGRFRNIDETDDHSGSSLGTGAEYDSVSNNDSCSGESEDQKEKTASVAPRPEAIPGCDNDKRDKIRQKNERKHQRQKERRAQELHERCSGYLMSRKLEALAQQLVSMGFSSERATMALILNEGRVEDSITWLLEGSEGVQQDPSLHSGGNLKIDIAEELARIADLEMEHKCTKQEVERAVVACEGDLDKAAETLRAQKLEPASAPPKLEETPDPPAANGCKLAVAANQNPIRTQAKTVAPVQIQQRIDEKDFNYTKASVAQLVASPESGNRSFQSFRRSQPKLEWARPQAATLVEKRWPSVSTSPSVSYSLASSLQVSPPPAKAEARYVVVGAEGKSMMHAGALREPVIMMQRPQSLNAKQNPTASMSASPPAVTPRWYPNGGAVATAGNEVMKGNEGLGSMPGMSLSTNNRSSQQFYHQQQYQPFPSSSVDPAPAEWGGPWSTAGTTSSSLAEPSSLGLFTGWGSAGPSSGASSPVDWSMGGSMQQFDYANIDWSVESNSTRQRGLLLGLASYAKSNQTYDGWSAAMTAGAKSTRPGMNGIRIAGMREGRVVTDVSSSSSSAGSHEWTSPFAGQDLFSVPRQFVTSPPL